MKGLQDSRGLRCDLLTPQTTVPLFPSPAIQKTMAETTEIMQKAAQKITISTNDCENVMRFRTLIRSVQTQCTAKILLLPQTNYQIDPVSRRAQAGDARNP